MRTPVFELHILPLFRATDREHMLFSLDLWNYDEVVARIDDLLARLGGSADMPPASHGGPWPDEWVALLTRWKSTGFKRLELGTAQYTYVAGTATARITAAGNYHAAGFRGWLQLDSITATERHYVLYFEAPDVAVVGVGPAFALRESYPLPDASVVFIRDSTGIHQMN